jgi:hypothetical protein
MPDVRALLQGGVSGQTVYKIQVGYVSQNQPAPSSLTEPLYAIVPGYDPSVPFGPLTWPASHGNALPAPGDLCVLAWDDNNTCHCVAWDGTNLPLGTATLVAGTVTIANTLIVTTSLVRVSRLAAGGTALGELDVDLTAGTGFTINAKSAVSTIVTTDTSTVLWEIVSY